MNTLGFKLFKDPDLTYELAAGDAKVALNSISQREQVITVYFGAWDEYDAATKRFTRKKITLQENDTFQWTLVREVDDGQGGTIEVPAVDLVKEVSVTCPDEDNVIELSPNNPVANFYYVSESDKKVTAVEDYTLWGNFNVGSFKHGWSTATNAEAGGFRLAKRDLNDPAVEIIMTREMRYGSGVTHGDRFTTYNQGDELPTDGWYVKDFWAYTYPNEENDDLQENDIIPRARTIQSGIANKIRIDITFALPEGASGTGLDFNYILLALPIKNSLYDRIEI
jgi:hypothetical protein